MLSVNGISREPTGLSVNGVEEFFATEGELWTNGQEHYDFFRRYGVSADSLKLWLDQSAIKSGTSLATWLGLSPRANDQKQLTASYQPSLSNTFMKDAARDADGVDNYMHQEEFDDETDAVFWPTNAGAAFNATNARFRVAGVDLSPFASAANDYMLVIHDSADKTAWGYIDVADSAEALGSELVGAGDCANFVTAPYDTFDGASATGFHAAKTTSEETDVAGTADEIVWVSGKLYLISFNLTLTSGTAPLLQIRSAFAGDNIGGTIQTVVGANAYYQIPNLSTTGIVQFYHAATKLAEYTIDSISVKEVTNVGADGVLIMSTKGGSTQSWALQESGIDLNDIDSFEVLKTTNQITAALSAFMWVKPDDGRPDASQVLACKWRDVNGFKSWELDLDTDGKIYIYLSGNGIAGGNYERTDVAFFANGQETWHHVGFTYDGANIVIYGDGVALASNTSGGAGIPAALYDVSEKLTIGALSTPGSYFAGLIGPTVFASRAYSATEASRLFQADRARFGV